MTSQSPASSDDTLRCPACSTVLRPGANRCYACGRVLGEANRCPSCNAIAGVRVVASQAYCAACGKPRERTPGTFVLSQSAAAHSTSAMARSIGTRPTGPWALPWYFGAFVVGSVGTVSTLIALVAAGWLPATALLLLTGVSAGLLTRTGRRRGKFRRRQRQELEVLALAAQAGGVLTATAVAKRLRLSTEEADQLLTAMVGDGSRVTAEIDRDGLLVYVFREVQQLEAAEASQPAVKLRASSEAVASLPPSQDADHGLEEEIAVRDRKHSSKSQVE